jgi:hypothetical protein
VISTIVIVAIFTIAVFAFCKMTFASRGVPTRPVNLPKAGDRQPDPLPDADPAHSWYIEPHGNGSTQSYSCSFIEFDDRGDYLDFRQHRHAYEKIQDLTKGQQPLIVVIYVHGWRNSSQSGNVTSFVSFLRQIATTALFNEGVRVHGVYLGWRGGVFKPTYPSAKELVATGFAKPIVDQRCSSPFPYLTIALETLLYWTDKILPEHKISGTSFSRSIYTLAQTTKRHGKKEQNKVFLLGHSMGALLLERTFMNATLGELTKEWPWGEHDSLPDPNPLPFDTVLLINSAAPSIYAKQFQGYLAAHRQAMIHDNVPGADAPIFISLTSEADWATGNVHRFANLLAGFSPTLQRDYHGYEDYILKYDPKDTSVRGPVVPQSLYYKRTPGHNPLLVNRWVERAETIVSTAIAMSENLRFDISSNQAKYFFTTSKKGGGLDKWVIRLPESNLTQKNQAWSSWQGYKPICWDRGDGNATKDRGQSAYWIIRCPGEIIGGHNDIWNQQAMETYAALFRIESVVD